MAGRSPSLEKLLEKQRQLAAQIAQASAREKAEDRKKDTRRKILIGGAVMASVKRGDLTQEQLTAILDKELKADRDRSLFPSLSNIAGQTKGGEDGTSKSS